MTRFLVRVEDTLRGVPGQGVITVHVHGGLQLGSNVGAVDSVTDGGRGVWFTAISDNLAVAIEGGLLSEKTPDNFTNGGLYLDGGVTIDQMRTMANWQVCGTRVYP
jgi:hypothetical protein